MEEKEAKGKGKGKESASNADLDELARGLQSAAFALKYALQNPVPVVGEIPDPDQVAVKEEVETGFQALVKADAQLEGLLFPDVTHSQP